MSLIQSFMLYLSIKQAGVEHSTANKLHQVADAIEEHACKLDEKNAAAIMKMNAVTRSTLMEEEYKQATELGNKE